jgi:dihydrofolate reductase
MKNFSAILATDDKNWIWKDQSLAWKLSEDLTYFKKMTTDSSEWKKNTVIMWRKTWDSIPERYKPLPNRINCILSREYDCEDKTGEIRRFWSFESALKNLSLDKGVDKIFVIGWWYLYNKVFWNNYLEYIYHTKVFWDFDCDIFVDKIPKKFKLKEASETNKENGIEFIFEVYKRVK